MPKCRYVTKDLFCFHGSKLAFFHWSDLKWPHFSKSNFKMSCQYVAFWKIRLIIWLPKFWTPVLNTSAVLFEPLKTIIPKGLSWRLYKKIESWSTGETNFLCYSLKTWWWGQQVVCEKWSWRIVQCSQKIENYWSKGTVSGSYLLLMWQCECWGELHEHLT